MRSATDVGFGAKRAGHLSLQRATNPPSHNCLLFPYSKTALRRAAASHNGQQTAGAAACGPATRVGFPKAEGQ